MEPVDFQVAWEHPPTRRSYLGHMLMNVVGLLGWVAAWIGLLYVLVLYLSPALSLLFLLPLCYCFYRAVVQLFYFPPALRMRRILQVYPWCINRKVSYGLADHAEVARKHYGWFEFSNPANPACRLVLVFCRHYRAEWWHRRMAPRADPSLKAEIETVWFAGDPRFVGLIAAPGRNGIAPRRFHVLEQWMTSQDGERFREWDVTAEDVERGRRAGIPSTRSWPYRGRR